MTPIPRTIEKMIAAVEAENPDIKISYTNYNYNPEYLAALAAGRARTTWATCWACSPAP